MFKRILNLSLIIALICPLITFASVYGILKGKVVDTEGKAVLGATVRVQGTTMGAAVRNKDGSFTIANITSGNYEVSIKAVGKKEVIKKVRISADEASEISVTLQDESVMGETVVVTADRAMVSKNAIGKQTSYTTEETNSTAAEGVANVVGLSAGVRNNGGGWNVRGSRNSETQIRVDGLDVGSQFTGGLGWGGTTYLPMVSTYGTEEVQVLTGGFSAEYGNAQGGVVNTVVKAGRTDRYEGYVRWRTDVPSLWGRQPFGLDLQKQDTRFVPVHAGEGAKLQGSGENNIEFGFGGPLPLPILKNSTFYISANNFSEKYRGNSYEIFDPEGNNLGKIIHNGTWRKNITARMRFAITNDIGLILGTQYGITSAEFGSSGSLYAVGNGYMINEQTGLGDSIMIPENLAKLPVGNTLVYNFMARLNHTLSSSSFYEITISRNTNDDSQSRRYIDPNTHMEDISDPNFFTGFRLLEPRDNYIISGSKLIKAPVIDGRVVGDKILDEYTNLTGPGRSTDGYFPDPTQPPGDFPVRNNLTGYYEGAPYASSANPWGLRGYFNTTGTLLQSVNFRYGSYWQFDGNYTNAFKTGEFSQIAKTGFELRTFEFHRHYNGNPYDGNPFYDIYTDKFGGNLYADTKKVWDLTSKPRKPLTFAYYVQDQISYKGIIFSPGLRLDMMNPNSTYRVPSKTFIPISSDTGFVDSPAKIQISPRINVTYPITDMSILSLSYNIYFKTPQFENLYDNYNTDILRSGNVIGNPNMEAQRTNEYQVAYQHQLNDYMSLGLTAYYRDQYNQLGVTFIPTIPTPFYQYSVAEYGNSRGIELELRKNPVGDHLIIQVNYTYAKVDGTAPDPASNFNVQRDYYTDKFAFPLAPYPMPQDVRHYFKGFVALTWGNDEGPSIYGIKLLENTDIGFNGIWRSGYPYTKTDKNGKLLGEYNAERQPSYWNIDARISKTFLLKDIFGESIGNTSVELFVDIYNLLNLRPVLGVYSATGDPIDNGTTLDKRIGDFSSTTYFKEATYENTASFASDQYDLYGNRWYNANSDHDKNGVVTQAEQFESYMNYAKTALSFLGNYAPPRTIYAGIMIRFN